MYGNSPTKVPYLQAKLTPYNTYFCTLTFKDEHKKGFKKWYFDTIITVTTSLLKCGTFHLVAEIGEKGNFHYHYIITMKDSVKHSVFLNYWVKTYGFKDIKKVDNFIGMFIYLRKLTNEFPKYIWDSDSPEANLRIIINSTVSLLLDVIRDRTKSVKKYNKIQQHKDRIKGTLDSFYRL